MRSSQAFVLLAAVLLQSACGESAVDPSASESCRVRMLDLHNATETLLQVKAQSTTHIIVTDRIDTADPWSVLITILGDGTLDLDISVPGVTMQQLLKSYVMADSAQFTFKPVEGHPCTDFERSLVYFLVLEWFYFG